MPHLLAVWKPEIENIIGLVILFVALLLEIVLFVGTTMAAMWGMNRVIPDKLTETTYGDFDFNSFQRVAFNNFLLRMFILFGGPILILHLLEYFLIFRDIIRHWYTIFFIMFVLMISAIAAGLYFMFRLDYLRLAILTGTSAVLYLILFPFMSWLGLFR